MRTPLPIRLAPQASLTLSGLRVVLDRRGWPRATLAVCRMSDDRDRLALFVAAEFEEPVQVPASKRGAEWIHLAKAQADLERAGRIDLSGAPKFGDDPPDFW